jgi:NADP-reducing hydrogenase subunit HndD
MYLLRTVCGCMPHCCALTEVDHTKNVINALADPTKTVVVQTAPAVRAALGEEFGMEPGTLVTGKMVAALRELGFDFVFDTDFAADLTIMEEGAELLDRLTNTYWWRQGCETSHPYIMLPGLGQLL